MAREITKRIKKHMKRGFCGFAFYKKTKNCGAREENYCSLAGGYSADYITYARHI